jgi:hypothetical protein
MDRVSQALKMSGYCRVARGKKWHETYCYAAETGHHWGRFKVLGGMERKA